MENDWKEKCLFCKAPLGDKWQNVGMVDTEEKVAVCEDCNKKIHKFYDLKD